MKNNACTKGVCRVIRRAAHRYIGDIILLYRLTEEKLNTNEIGIGDGYAYSLTVTKVDLGGSRREVKHLRDIARDRREAERIFETVSRGLVPPCTASEIVSDLIGI